jgi:hypothetical protein
VGGQRGGVGPEAAGEERAADLEPVAAGQRQHVDAEAAALSEVGRGYQGESEWALGAGLQGRSPERPREHGKETPECHCTDNAGPQPTCSAAAMPACGSSKGAT